MASSKSLAILFGVLVALVLLSSSSDATAADRVMMKFNGIALNAETDPETISVGKYCPKCCLWTDFPSGFCAYCCTSAEEILDDATVGVEAKN